MNNFLLKITIYSVSFLASGKQNLNDYKKLKNYR